MSDGSAEWLRELGNIISALEGPAIEEGISAWASTDVVPDARRRVPKLTGATARSIEFVAGPGGATIFAGTHYSPIIENGSGARMANPFLLPAIIVNLPKLGDHIDRAVRRRII